MDSGLPSCGSRSSLPVQTVQFAGTWTNQQSDAQRCTQGLGAGTRLREGSLDSGFCEEGLCQLLSISRRIILQVLEFSQVKSGVGRLALVKTHIGFTVGLTETKLDDVHAGISTVQANLQVGVLSHACSSDSAELIFVGDGLLIENPAPRRGSSLTHRQVANRHVAGGESWSA